MKRATVHVSRTSVARFAGSTSYTMDPGAYAPGFMLYACFAGFLRASQAFYAFAVLVPVILFRRSSTVFQAMFEKNASMYFGLSAGL